MLRLFRFANQSDGDAYLHSHHPVYYLKALHGEVAPLPTPVYKGRHHPRSVREGGLQAEFDVYNQTLGFFQREKFRCELSLASGCMQGTCHVEFFPVPRKMLEQVGQAMSRKLAAVRPTRFEPLMIQGLQCLNLSSRQPVANFLFVNALLSALAAQ